MVGDGEDHVAEVGGPHAGVAAVLVDLVGGGLDEDEGVVSGSLG